MRAPRTDSSAVEVNTTAAKLYFFTHFDNTSSHHVLLRFDFVAQPWEAVSGPQGIPSHRYTLPPGTHVLHQQQLWRRPSSPQRSPLPADVYVGPGAI